MTIEGPQHLKSRLAKLPFRVAAFVVLFAFLSQSYVIQAHFHGTPARAGQGIERVVAHHLPPSNSPLDGSPFDCPICQAYAHAGTYFAPASLLLLGPVSWVERVISFFAPRAISVATTRSGRSRAPPKH